MKIQKLYFIMPFFFTLGCMSIDENGTLSFHSSSSNTAKQQNHHQNNDSQNSNAQPQKELKPTGSLIVEKKVSKPKSIIDTHPKAAGTDVAIIATSKGLLAIGADGKYKKTILKGEILWNSVDNKAGVIWFIKKTGKSTTLYYQDILKNSSPVVMIKKYPMDSTDFSISSPLGFRVKYSSGYVTTIGTELYVALIDLDFTATLPKFVITKGMEADNEDSGIKIYNSNWAKAKFFNQGKLIELYERSKNRVLSKPWKNPATPQKPDVASGDCGSEKEDDEYCGSLTSIPYTSLYFVVIGKTCGDGCHSYKALYNPKTKKYINPKNFTQSSSDYEEYKKNQGLPGGTVSPSGKAIIWSGTIMNFKKGNVYTEGKDGGGWLGGGIYVK